MINHSVCVLCAACVLHVVCRREEEVELARALSDADDSDDMYSSDDSEEDDDSERGEHDLLSHMVQLLHMVQACFTNSWRMSGAEPAAPDRHVVLSDMQAIESRAGPNLNPKPLNPYRANTQYPLPAVWLFPSSSSPRANLVFVLA